MSDKDRVLAVYPDATIWGAYGDPPNEELTYVGNRYGSVELSAKMTTESEAWADAASRLPKEQPSTPCEYCGPICYGGAEHNERVENGDKNTSDAAPVPECDRNDPWHINAAPVSELPPTFEAWWDEQVKFGRLHLGSGDYWVSKAIADKAWNSANRAAHAKIAEMEQQAKDRRLSHPLSIEAIQELVSDLRAALARIAELEEVIGETYQMVGAVSCDYPEIIPGVEKWLDHLSKGKLIHGSLLPFLPAESDLRAAHAKIAEMEQEAKDRRLSHPLSIEAIQELVSDLKRLRDAAVMAISAIEDGKIYTRDGERILEALRSGVRSEEA